MSRHICCCLLLLYVLLFHLSLYLFYYFFFLFFFLLSDRIPFFFFFFFNDPAPPEIYPLSLHAALPISAALGDVLHREARHGETVGQLGSRTAPRDEIPEPGQRNTHGRRLRRILAEEAEVVLEEEPQVVQIVAEEGETIDAHAERKAAHHLRIIADGAQHVRMDHPRPQDLEPALAATHATARGRSAGHGARRARDVDLRTRLGERKEAGAEAD